MQSGQKIIILSLLPLFLSFTLVAAEDEQSNKITSTNVDKVAKASATDAGNKGNKVKQQQAAIVINSRVTGSQEQPKVLYIMPWQGIKNPITINDSKRTIVMPKFQPINPKVFKQQVSDYHKKSS